MTRDYFWALITIIIAIILAMFLLMLARDDSSEGFEQIYQGVPVDAHLLRIDKQALEEAYRAHVLLLFSVWLKDDISVVHRINTGLRRGREAYALAAARIEERERILKERTDDDRDK